MTTKAVHTVYPVQICSAGYVAKNYFSDKFNNDGRLWSSVLLFLIHLCCQNTYNSSNCVNNASFKLMETANLANKAIYVTVKR